jgi:hypothetical protein
LVASDSFEPVIDVTLVASDAIDPELLSEPAPVDDVLLCAASFADEA